MTALTLIERDLEDCTEAYGDWPEIDTPCDYSPVGQCEYAGPNDRECRWCRKPSGLDQ